ncbi:uncharacterized protein TNCV_2048011 [Trichonephila clavipes]|nr:uncharacterized protein TNCV_2048011 [Trichonephila clavipes]
MVSWEYLWPTLRCKRVAEVSPLPSIGWWYLSSVSPKRHCCRVSAADKGCRVYPLDPRPDAVELYSGYTPCKRHAWFCQMTGTLPPLLDSVVGGGTPGRSFLRVFMDPNMLCPAVLGIGGEPKSIKKLRGVISEPDLLSTPESEILEGFSDQGYDSSQANNNKKNSNIIPKKHLILTFNSPKLPSTVKAGYLNCKIRAYIPNPLRCFKCQRFGHLQIACRGQLTCSRCASVGHSSADCSLELNCVNCSQPHSSDSKQCPKWKAEKGIQAIKTNRNISYLEARKLIAPQLSQTYAQVAKPSTVTSTTQTDENITQIKCPPLQLLQPLLSVPQPDKSNSVSTLSSATQADLLPSTSSIAATVSEPPHLVPVFDTLPSTTSNMFTPIEPSSSILSASLSNSSIQPPSVSSTQNLKKKVKTLG